MVNVKRNVPLGPLTTLGVGGAAEYFVRADEERDVEAAFGFARDEGLPVFVLGGGSNIVVSDAGFGGLVVQVVPKGVSYEDRGNNVVRVTAAAGEDWDGLVGACVDRVLAGIECLSGIPGFVGGTPVQNVGAYGQEVSETIASVRCFDRDAGTFVELTNEDCGFSYRTSIFNTIERERYVVTSVVFDLKRGGNPRLVYKDLKERFGDRTPTLAEIRAAVLEVRRLKSMVIDPADPNSRSAGSFFKNPIVAAESVSEMAETAEVNSVPTFPAGKGLAKVPAAWLIEKAGFGKGYRLGNAGISANHSLAIVNLGGAEASEIIALKDAIQAGVMERFGIELQPEPILVGF
jgi:UDP-N-acetylmuramate dehydrogenase